ncbi:ATP-dependent RNA helicase RhlE [Poriferisphaera corsica]|uniref:ATP-dependent RNA helicase RhlE n=2 Tax=Poriferisphaera corsica TaxID=2528020 RepID=A0A517YQM4_9BACT|nr:ATP-dependent RNA helicase RhlE [Poriferisphaera corsica]
MRFEEMGLIEPLMRAVSKKGYETPTEIQREVFSDVMAGKDVLGIAQTGTGKTAAFALPILQKLYKTKPKVKLKEGKKPGKRGGGRRRDVRDDRAIRGLVMVPTRELAEQVSESFQAYGQYTGLRRAVVYGGVKQGRQVMALERGVDILVATPGRMFDLMEQGYVNLDKVEICVLDEADRMLDMGFLPDIRALEKALPKGAQHCMFSATLPRSIRGLADSILNDPEFIEIEPETIAAETVHQVLYEVERKDKPALLRQLLSEEHLKRVLVFCRTKRNADKLVQRLAKFHFTAESIHSDRSQGARQRALDGFKNGDVDVLIATDIAARGIDVSDISHVVNYDLPEDPETYIHRIGRTGRAGASGDAISFVSHDDGKALRLIERLLGWHIPIKQHSFENEDLAEILARGGKKKTELKKKKVKTRPGVGRVSGGNAAAPKGKTKSKKKASRKAVSDKKQTKRTITKKATKKKVAKKGDSFKKGGLKKKAAKKKTAKKVGAKGKGGAKRSSKGVRKKASRAGAMKQRTGGGVKRKG